MDARVAGIVHLILSDYVDAVLSSIRNLFLVLVALRADLSAGHMLLLCTPSEVRFYR